MPQGTAYPYVNIGEFAGSDWSTKTTSGMQFVATLRIWSREGGRTEAATIMTRLHTLLHQAPLNVVGQTLVGIRFITSSVMPLGDGWTYQGIIRFRARLQAN